jgi:hypothetical protein
MITKFKSNDLVLQAMFKIPRNAQARPDTPFGPIPYISDTLYRTLVYHSIHICEIDTPRSRSRYACHLSLRMPDIPLHRMSSLSRQPPLQAVGNDRDAESEYDQINREDREDSEDDEGDVNDFITSE